MGEYISLDDLKSPSKNKVDELCMGRYVYNLGKAELHDVNIDICDVCVCIYMYV